MARSKWKFIFFSNFIWRKILRFFKSKNSKILRYRKIFYNRSSAIPSCFKGVKYMIHKGNKIRRFRVNKFTVGKKFGEFAFTRKSFHFPLRKKKGSNLLKR